MKFKDFLLKSHAKHGVLAFGRMNPPTIGHLALVDKVKDVAKNFGGDHNIVLSHSSDPKKNPLTAQQKAKHAKRFFPGTNITLADKDKPTILHHAAEMHKKGITHIHVVGGSDRTDEYYKLLHKYNDVKSGHGFYDFKHITVHSAGERDPDAEGVSGMSASKMREHAKNNNFKEFKKGIPGHVKDEHAKELFGHVRQGMKIEESLDFEFSQLINEGVHDKGIFKAVFLGGGPGSGKDFVLDKTLAGHGLTEINSDKALEFLMDKNNLDMRMPDNEKEARNVVRSKAKNMIELKQKLALLGRNGLIINGTGDDVEKISRIKERLEDLGYETAMIMVNTADEVSKARNVERGQRGGRTVPEDIRKEKWDSVQRSRPQHAKMFGQDYIEFDNSEDLRTAPPEVVDAKKKEMDGIFKTIQKFVTKPPKNPSASNWVADQLQRKDTFKVDTTKEYTPHQDSKAAEQAKQMGLDYYGFGRYGKNGKVTHRSIHDKLVDVQKLQPTVTKKKSLKESYNLSDSGALNMLLLGNRIQEYELENFVENKQPKYLVDSSGNVRVFMLRRAAAEEAHQKNGVVIPFKNGYVVKLKEEFHNVDQVFEEFISGFGGADNQSKTSSSSTTSTFLTEAKTTHNETKNSTSTTKESFVNATRKKITISEIRKRQEESLIESIDKGIEPGLSMAGAGESPARDMGEKWKKKTGKSSPVVETIGATGDDVLNSMSDQKDGELRRKGIRLSTFKSRNPIG
jgi:hypothetical protein